MGKFIQLAEDVFQRWKNCMSALSMQSDSEMADFLLNRLLTERLRDVGQQDSREGSPSPVTSDSMAPRDAVSSPVAPMHNVHIQSLEGSVRPHTIHSQAVEGGVSRQHGIFSSTNPRHGVMEMHGRTNAPRDHAPRSASQATDDFGEYKHKLERRKRKPVADNAEDGAIKVAKTACEVLKMSSSQGPVREAPQMGAPSRIDHPAAEGETSPCVIQTARIPTPTETREAGSIPTSTVKRQDVIVTPQSLPRSSSKPFHGTFGEEAIDLSVQPSKDLRKALVAPPKSCLESEEKSRDASPRSQFLSASGGGAYMGAYNSSDMSNGSPRCRSPQTRFNNNKALSNDSGSDYDCCSGSPADSTQQSQLAGKDERESAVSSPKPGANMGGIESIVQRLHQVKSETPSRSDSEDESDYYAVTFKDLIARTISRCDRYGKTNPRGKRKRVLKTSSELNAARREEITAAKKLLARVSKKKRDKFMLTVNCSTDGSEHVRNAAASEAIATLVRNVWHKENPKPIGQVIKEMVAKKLAVQEEDPDDPRGKRKGPMTIKDILNRRSDSLDNLDRSPESVVSDKELMIVSDSAEKEDLENEADLSLSAADTLRKMAKVNERRDSDENRADLITPDAGERESLDEDSDDDDPVTDVEKKQSRRRSKKKKRRWAKMFAKGTKTDETNTDCGDRSGSQVDSEANESQDGSIRCAPPVQSDRLSSKAPKDKDDGKSSPCWPSEAVHSEGSIAQTVIQSSGKTGMESMRSLVEHIQDEDEEEIDIMEVKDIPLLRQKLFDQRDSTERNETDSVSPNPHKDPPKTCVISHSISQILEQKSDSSENRGRAGSASSGKAHLSPQQPQQAVLPEGSVGFPGPLSDSFSSVPRQVDAEPTSASPDGSRISRQGSREEGSSEIKSISTAADYLIRFALMQGNGQRQGTVESQ